MQLLATTLLTLLAEVVADEATSFPAILLADTLTFSVKVGEVLFLTLDGRDLSLAAQAARFQEARRLN